MHLRYLEAIKEQKINVKMTLLQIIRRNHCLFETVLEQVEYFSKTCAFIYDFEAFFILIFGIEIIITQKYQSNDVKVLTSRIHFHSLLIKIAQSREPQLNFENTLLNHRDELNNIFPF